MRRWCRRLSSLSARAASSRATATPQKLPPPSSPSKLPAIPGQGGQGQEQSGSRSTPGKARGAPTMTAPTMAAPTANMANISEAGDTAVHHGESSPAAGRGARTVVHVALQATPPPEEGQTTKADGAPLVCEFSFVSIRCNSDPMVC